MNNEALMLSDQGKYKQAEEMHRRTLELKETTLFKEGRAQKYKRVPLPKLLVKQIWHRLVPRDG